MPNEINVESPFSADVLLVMHIYKMVAHTFAKMACNGETAFVGRDPGFLLVRSVDEVIAFFKELPEQKQKQILDRMSNQATDILEGLRDEGLV